MSDSKPYTVEYDVSNGAKRMAASDASSAASVVFWSCGIGILCLPCFAGRDRSERAEMEAMECTIDDLQITIKLAPASGRGKQKRVTVIPLDQVRAVSVTDAAADICCCGTFGTADVYIQTTSAGSPEMPAPSYSIYSPRNPEEVVDAIMQRRTALLHNRGAGVAALGLPWSLEAA